jgi:hypothetical protein
MLSHCSRFPPLPVISSLIRRTIEFQHINDLVVPIDYNIIRPPSSKYDLVVWVCSISFHFFLSPVLHHHVLLSLHFGHPC